MYVYIYIYIYIYINEYVLLLCLLLCPPRRGRMQALSSEFKIDQADFIYWMSFLPSNLIKEISPNPKALSANT